MEQDWFERLTGVMARMAAGDTAALEELYIGFGNPILLITSATQFATVGSIPAPVDEATEPVGVMKKFTITLPDRSGFASSCFS